MTTFSTIDTKTGLGFCHSPVDIRASEHAGMGGSECGEAQINAEVSAEIDRRMRNTGLQLQLILMQYNPRTAIASVTTDCSIMF